MPRYDGTGPLGTGPIGWGLGPCERGLAFRRGLGKRFWIPRTTEAEEKEILKEELKSLKEEMQEVEKRLKELKA